MVCVLSVGGDSAGLVSVFFVWQDIPEWGEQSVPFFRGREVYSVLDEEVLCWVQCSSMVNNCFSNSLAVLPYCITPYVLFVLLFHADANQAVSSADEIDLSIFIKLMVLIHETILLSYHQCSIPRCWGDFHPCSSVV